MKITQSIETSNGIIYLRSIVETYDYVLESICTLTPTSNGFCCYLYCINKWHCGWYAIWDDVFMYPYPERLFICQKCLPGE